MNERAHSMQIDPAISTRFGHARNLLGHVWKHFKEDRCLEEAASLSYTSLLSLVPLLAVTFGIISAFPVFGEWSDRLQQFIFDNLIPTAGEQVVPQLNAFLESVSSLTLPGTSMLIVTALMLMIRIEVAFNRVWRVQENRSMVNRITMYWAVLTLGPLLMGAAIALSAQKVLGLLGISTEFSPALHRIGMFVLSWLIFTMVFVLVPNRRVQFRHAMIGAALSAVLFELAKMGFVAFVSNTNYKVIYGALATIPIFLIWLYLVWIVILFGASLAASLTTFRAYTREGGEWPENWSFQLAYRLVGHFWEAQRQGASLDEATLMEKEQHASEFQVVYLLGHLHDAGVIKREHEGDWLLVRDLDEMTLGELYTLLKPYLPMTEIDRLPAENDWDRNYIAALRDVRDESKQSWRRSLRSMYLSNGDKP